MDVAAAADLNSINPAWLLMGMAVMAMVYLTVRPRKRDPLSAAPKFSLSAQKTLENDMQNVIVELSELTRQMSAQLETRAAKLELLIRDADERVATLEAAAQTAAQAAAAKPATLTLARIGDEAVLVEPMPTPAMKPVRGMRLADDSTSGDRWNDVYRHAADGQSAREIARTMGRPQGEIELILALRPKPRTVASSEVAASAAAVG